MAARGAIWRDKLSSSVMLGPGPKSHQPRASRRPGSSAAWNSVPTDRTAGSPR